MESKELTQLIKEEDLDGFIHYDPENPNMRYLLGTEGAGNYLLLSKENRSVLLVSILEYEKARKNADVDEVRKIREFYREDQKNSYWKAVERFLSEYEVEKAGIGKEMPVGVKQRLDEFNELEILEDPVSESRQIKSEKEIQNLRTAQKATEKAMKKAESILRESEVREDKVVYEDKPLTSEFLKKEIKKELVENNAENGELIVSSGKDTANPHSRGEGIIKPDEPIIIDITPEESGYHGDMTRTFVKGEAPEKIKEMYRTAKEAWELIDRELQKGEITCADLTQKVTDLFEENGFDVPGNGELQNGFIHALGHGIGIEIHEKPHLSTETELEKGLVMAIEPGLYEQGVGGVRLEDVVLITEDGYENFNSMAKELEI